MKQRAPRRPLPTGHHSNDLVPLPAGTIPDDDDAVWRNVAWPPPPDMLGNYCRRLCYIVLIALPLIMLGETPFVDVTHGILRDVLATTFLIRVVRNIDFLEG